MLASFFFSGGLGSHPGILQSTQARKGLHRALDTRGLQLSTSGGGVGPCPHVLVLRCGTLRSAPPRSLPGIRGQG